VLFQQSLHQPAHTGAGAFFFLPVNGAVLANWVKLKFAGMNLKKLATWKWKQKNPSPGKNRKGIPTHDFSSVLLFFPFQMQKPVLV